MNTHALPHSSAWAAFNSVIVLIALVMVAVGLFFLPVELWTRSYLAKVC